MDAAVGEKERERWPISNVVGQSANHQAHVERDTMLDQSWNKIPLSPQLRIYRAMAVMDRMRGEGEREREREVAY